MLFLTELLSQNNTKLRTNNEGKFLCQFITKWNHWHQHWTEQWLVSNISFSSTWNSLSLSSDHNSGWEDYFPLKLVEISYVCQPTFNALDPKIGHNGKRRKEQKMRHGNFIVKLNGCEVLQDYAQCPSGHSK